MTKSKLTLTVVLLGFVQGASAAEGKPQVATSITPRAFADSLHAVIAAVHKAYVEAASSPAPSGSLNHAELLRVAAHSIQKTGAEFSYTLRSLSPINPSNGPQTQTEQIGLTAVTKNPDEAFYAEEELGGRSYFTAIYAERAMLRSCIDCHNRHPKSPRRDLKNDDVIGAIVVRVPLEF